MIQALNRQRNWIFVFLIAVTAIFLRLYAIDRLPPGLFGDEAVEGLDALDVLAGNLAIWFHAHLGREPMFVYLVALSYSALGVTPLGTRLPSIIAGLLTLPAAFWCVREWARAVVTDDRATRLAFLTTALLAISFWHIQMTRDAHRDTLLPLVEAIGYAFLWRALRTHSARAYVVAGAVLGLAIYTYSPGRFVGIFVAVFLMMEAALQLASRIAARRSASQGSSTQLTPAPGRFSNMHGRFGASALDWRGLTAAALTALIVMLPLGIYFAQNPVQFSRRFASVSIFDFDAPFQAFVSSVSGNLGQFVIPGAGYESTHYNLPGKPVFDLLIAPWFLFGLGLAFARARQRAYRFLILWFVLMATPAFLTADMIPKGVRVLGVVPGVFVFPALAMDFVVERFHAKSFERRAATGLIAVCLVGSAVWTGYDYFWSWASLPDLPLAFDSDMVEISDYIHGQPSDQPIFVSTEVYRHPTFMLLGKHVPTSQYFDRSTVVREFDARTSIITNSSELNAIDLFVRDYKPPADWLARVAPQASFVQTATYFSAYRLGAPAAPQHPLDMSFNPFLKLVGYSRYDADPSGIVLEWQAAHLPDDRVDMQEVLSLVDSRGNIVIQDKRTFGVQPMEWTVGDLYVEWFETQLPTAATHFTIQLTRGTDVWQSPDVSFSVEPQ